MARAGHKYELMFTLLQIWMIVRSNVLDVRTCMPWCTCMYPHGDSPEGLETTPPQ